MKCIKDFVTEGIVSSSVFTPSGVYYHDAFALWLLHFGKGKFKVKATKDGIEGEGDIDLFVPSVKIAGSHINKWKGTITISTTEDKDLRGLFAAFSYVERIVLTECSTLDTFEGLPQKIDHLEVCLLTNLKKDVRCVSKVGELNAYDNNLSAEEIADGFHFPTKLV